MLLRVSVRRRFTVHGVVQGVGFRPFVHNTAVRLGLGGFVRNSPAGVVIEAEGRVEGVDTLERALREELPPLARIDGMECVGLAPCGDAAFEILESSGEGETAPVLPPDMSTCDDCLREIDDPANRRYRYPFTNCTRCGPRYTIIRELPYDRARTTMAAFVMCAECQAEYDDPHDRRFHAQPNACPRCGPALQWDLDTARAAIQRGEIVAVRGLGGFQLVCDATQPEVVARLRLRKRRSEKPFAVMVPDLASAERLCAVSEEERAALLSRERPIVLLTRHTDAPHLAPGTDTLGVMLPYTPLHELLVRGFEALVVTSGNLSEEPIVIDNESARDRLAGVADAFLLHDRDIHTRVDDSVVRLFEGRVRALRRARSFVPRPIDLGVAVPEIVACGAQLKNTLCLTKGRLALVSQHIGDLENYETLVFFEETLERMKRLFRVTPTAVAHDMHPGYLSTRLARSMEGVMAIGVQHHHAHVASCMAENGVRERVIGVAMDGTGYGEDGAIWGAEFLSADLVSFRRRAHFRYVPLAGGDTAVRQTWRPALAYLRDAGLDDDALRGVDERQRAFVASMIEHGIQTVPTSSAGRLFDAVASILGVRHEATFEAQAAIELEAIARGAEADGAYDFDLTSGEPMEVDLRPMIRRIVEDRERGTDVRLMAARFHETIGRVIEEVCVRIRNDEGLNRVCLSGGTFQNWLLLGIATERLRRRGFEVLLHTHVPPNDGGISLGQAAVAGARLARGI
jgi:hydrogenase maturation protein HypF